MNFTTLNASWRLASLSNKILLVANLALSFAIILLAGAAIHNRDRLVILPPSVEKPFVVGWSEATPEYYKSMALYFSNLFGMIGPKNVDFIVDLIDKYCDRPVADGIKSRIRAIAGDYTFQQSTSTTWFEPEQTAWEKDTGKVFVIGKLMTSTHGAISGKPAVYEFRIIVRESQPVITHFDSYEGKMPHTQEWLTDPRMAEADIKRRQTDEADSAEKLRSSDIRKSNQDAAAGIAGGAK